jgi:AcrR family transcriptional regulator
MVRAKNAMVAVKGELVPKEVDPGERRRAIANAAIKLIAAGGPQALTMRALAAELNGSMTMVTHYYASRRELLLDLVHQVTDGWQQELAELEATKPDARSRLRTLLEWSLPTTSEGREEERFRFALTTVHQDPECSEVLRGFDTVMRGILRSHLQELVPARHVDDAVRYLRAITNGVALEDYLYTDSWPLERQLKLVDDMLRWIDELKDVE